MCVTMFYDNDNRIKCVICLQEFEDKRQVIPHNKEKHPQQYEEPSHAGSFECPMVNCDIIFVHTYSFKSLVLQSKPL